MKRKKAESFSAQRHALHTLSLSYNFGSHVLMWLYTKSVHEKVFHGVATCKAGWFTHMLPALGFFMLLLLTASVCCSTTIPTPT